MRTKTFARTVAAFATMGMVLNSSCAPDKSRKTRVLRNHSPFNALNAHLVKSVKKADGSCGTNQVATKSDVQTLQSEVDKQMGAGTPITADELPPGVYTLSSVVGNIEAHNVPSAANNFASLAANISTEYDYYKKADVKLTTSKNDLSEECDQVAIGGQAPGPDIGRSEAIDTFFVIDAQHNVKHDISATFNVRANQTGIAPGQPAFATMQVRRGQAAAKLPANWSLIRRMMMAPKDSIDSTTHTYLNVIDGTARGVYDPRSTATVTLSKLSDTEYQIAINYKEYVKGDINSQTDPSRQIILTYSVALTSPTTTPGSNSSASATTAMKTPSQAKAPQLPPPAPPAASASAAASAPVNQNQQPPQSQQDLDAKNAAAAAAASTQQNSMPAADPNAAATGTGTDTATAP